MSLFEQIEKRMTSFEAVIIEVEDAFHGKPYTKFQNAILQDLYHRYGLPSFRRCALTIIREKDSKPYPKFWADQLKHMTQRQVEEVPNQPIRCDHCMDTGLCFINDPDQEHIVAKCFCNSGLDQEKRILPRLEKNMGGLIKPFPVDLFVPARRSDLLKSKSQNNSELPFQHIVDWWADVIKNSEKYWSKSKQQKQGGNNDYSN